MVQNPKRRDVGEEFTVDLGKSSQGRTRAAVGQVPGAYWSKDKHKIIKIYIYKEKKKLNNYINKFSDKRLFKLEEYINGKAKNQEEYIRLANIKLLFL